MEWRDKYSLTLLEKYTYRQLQKIGKDMNLPCNVKKIYLIQLIHTKVFGSENEIESILQRIKLERLEKARVRMDKTKQMAQAQAQQPQISPPISLTPRRESDHTVQRIQYVDQIHSYSYNERVLRNRAKRGPGKMYGVMNVNNTIIGVIKTDDKPPKNLKNAPLIKIYQENEGQSSVASERAIAPKTQKTAPKRRFTLDIRTEPAKRARRAISGIFPITSQAPVKKYAYEFVEGTLMIKNEAGITNQVRQNDEERQSYAGSTQNCQDLSQGYAQLTQNYSRTQMPRKYGRPNRKSTKDYSEIENNQRGDENPSQVETSSIQTQTQYTESMENCAETLLNFSRNTEIESQNHLTKQKNESLTRSSFAITNIETSTRNSCTYTSNTKYPQARVNIENIQDNNGMEQDYLHKKIRAEQVRHRRESRKSVVERPELPRISEVFTSFSGYSVNQPVYVPVKDHRSYDSFYLNMSVPYTTPLVLEAIYNVRAPAPLAPVLPIASVYTVYTSRTCVTAVAQPSSYCGPFTVASYEPNEYFQSNNLCNYYEIPEQDGMRQNYYTSEEQNSPSNTSMEMIATQVEDALELISQDGDYMERIGMPARAACGLCGERAPLALLERHIRQQHASQIHKYQTLWRSRHSLLELSSGITRVCGGPDGLILLYATADTYYLKARLVTSRTLNSTFRYVRFVKKLRALEEEERKGAENTLKDLRDNQSSDFFIRCDRRSLINNVARRVDLCLASYEQDLQEKRYKLVILLQKEEEENIRKFAEQTQAGAEAAWRDKLQRLDYLLAKRKREHEEKYKDTPLSKCAHVLPCVYKLRAKETEEIQLYQIKEKQARQASEREIDNMWHEVAMKEADALAARMEYDTLERLRRDLECKQFGDYQLEERRKQRERERERLKEETRWFRSMWEQDIKNEEEAENQRKEKRMQVGRERKQMIEERLEKLAQKKHEAQIISDTWDSLAGQGQADVRKEEEMRRRKERDLGECNKRMALLRDEIAKMATSNDAELHAEARRMQDEIDRKRCAYLLWSQKTNSDVRKAMVEQIEGRAAARAQLAARLKEEDEYHAQLHSQLLELSKHKELTEAEARKKHQRELLEQIEYNKLLKDRARQEELDQIKKAKLATEEYQEQINKMLCRPFFSDEVHPFTKQTAKKLELCPCSKKGYCK